MVLHTTGPLDLFSVVDPSVSTLDVRGRRLVLELVKDKERDMQWRRLTRVKHGWIRTDHDRSVNG